MRKENEQPSTNFSIFKLILKKLDDNFSKIIINIANNFIPLFKHGESSSSFVKFLVTNILDQKFFSDVTRVQQIHILKLVSDMQYYSLGDETKSLMSYAMQKLFMSFVPLSSPFDPTTELDFQKLGFSNLTYYRTHFALYF